MADIAVTVANVAPAKSTFESFTFIAAVAITKGAAVYVNSSGLVALADGSAAGTAICIGIALQKVSAGQAVEVLTRGMVAGFTLAGAYGSAVYLSDTDAGILADAAGTVSRVIGAVWPTSDQDKTKVLMVGPALA